MKDKLKIAKEIRAENKKVEMLRREAECRSLNEDRKDAKAPLINEKKEAEAIEAGIRLEAKIDVTDGLYYPEGKTSKDWKAFKEEIHRFNEKHSK